MFKLVVLSALLAVVAAKPGFLHGGGAHHLGYTAAVAAPLAHAVHAIPTAVSHSSRTDVIHSPVVATYAAPAIAHAAIAAPAVVSHTAYAAPAAVAVGVGHLGYAGHLGYGTGHLGYGAGHLGYGVGGVSHLGYAGHLGYGAGHLGYAAGHLGYGSHLGYGHGLGVGHHLKYHL